MANTDVAQIVAHVATRPYASELRRLYGQQVFADTRKAFAAMTEALEFFQQTPAEFSPFTSKYDAFLRHQTELTPQETRGLAAFNDPEKGNCAHCHKSQPSATGDLPVFTDFGLVAVGAPRNMAIPANADPSYYDLGACGPDRKDLAGRDDFCGVFKTPTLRNVALRQVFFHNGVFHSLTDAVAFYATRDTNPERWYPVDASGQVSKFNDLPEKYWENINDEPPFDRHAGGSPALSPDEVADIVAFLYTLTDGYQPPVISSNPAR
jgi:cytochrome c peroxidase